MIAELVLNWYSKNKRRLPWRGTSNPYKIWLSEIILQQTRIKQGTAYYERFIKNYPTVFDLAAATQDEVLKLWQGLGYYSRARNLHYTAQYIVKQYKGSFPQDYKKLLALKGIGEYTAAAIASFAFNLVYPTIDGNVYRVLSRLFNINTAINTTKGKKEFYAIAKELINKDNPGDYNQAMMEMGALICTPTNPQCEKCPCHLHCLALKHKKINQLPVKQAKIKPKNRYFNYLLIFYQNNFYLQKRTQNDIWKNLYELPLIETDKEMRLTEFSQNLLIKQLQNNYDGKIIEETIVVKHILSHQNLFAKLFLIEINQLINKDFRAKFMFKINCLNMILT